MFAALTFALSGGYLQAPAVVTTPPPASAVVAQADAPVAAAETVAPSPAEEPARPVVVAVAAPLWTDAVVPAGVTPVAVGSRAPPAV
ncbi:hypothetical protein Val02_33620 [Virgisporangium aliadipatigenens]|uniref:Uncharacterized protein n=1 Tax=Virgisporangium aliadipatigenens TaxID=741659 RepID=A0A8J3YMB2_9ACTN|nr:hypothetical protein Val02_33620 [Virgisporangium aliadipatigenens]